MGNDESKTINYVIFGKREELTQFPRTDQVEILNGESEKIQFRPIYLFWDKTDEMLVQFYEQWKVCEKTGLCGCFMRGVSVLAKNHIRNKYREVFLTNPETLFLSHRAENEIPVSFWRESPRLQKAWFQGFGKEKARSILDKSQCEMTVFLVLDEECNYEEVQTWLLMAEGAAKVNMKNLFLFGAQEQKENSEEVLEQFYMETGLAGSFYPVPDCKKIISQTQGDVLLLDCLGLSVSEVGRPTYYVDGAGVRSEKEIRRLTGVCKACYSLRNHLDRAFLSAL